MTVSDQILAVQAQMQNIKAAINTKAGSTVVGDNTSEYASAIDGLSVGKNIPREVSSTGAYQKPSSNFIYRLPSTAIDVGDYALDFALKNCRRLTSVDLSSLTTVSGSYALNYAFYYCTALTSVDLSNLTTVSGSNALESAFQNCTALTSVDLSSLADVSGSYALYYAFNKCTSLTSVDLSSLTTVSGSYALYNAFQSCTKLTNVYFRALTSSSFGSYKNQFQGMLSVTGTSVTHTLHFPSNMESTISTLSGYPTFGGTSGYVTLAYDLPATS